MLKSAQVREALGIGRDKLRELILEGELEAIRTGGAHSSPYRISEESVAAYLERHKVVPTEAASS